MHKTELLAFGSVIGILGVISGYLILDARSQLRDVVRLSHMRDLQMGLDVFFLETGSYPSAEEALALGSQETACLDTTGFRAPCPEGSSPFISVVPSTPAQGISSDVSCSGVAPAYCYKGNAQVYRVEFELESAHERLGLAKGKNCLTETGFKKGECSQLY